jgi:hypothetical protein
MSPLCFCARLRPYGEGKVPPHAMVQFRAYRRTGEMLPYLKIGIVVRRGDELEQASAELQGASRAKYLRAFREKAHVKLNKRS